MASDVEQLDIDLGKLHVRQVVMFKHGVAYYGLQGAVQDASALKLTFKMRDLDDILKSIAVADLSGNGYISAITYDATEDEGKLLESAAMRVPENESFSRTLNQLKGAQVELDVGGRQVIGTIVGIEIATSWLSSQTINKPSLVVLDSEASGIAKFPFADIQGFKLQSEDLSKELQFFLDAAMSAKKKESRVVTIACEGTGTRDVAVSYITESPIWKTSYRIVLPQEREEKENEPESDETRSSNYSPSILLSGWCLVENTTDQDWDRVDLSLVAGMPVSFKMPLFRPIYIDRPHVQPAQTTGATVMDIADEMDRIAYTVAQIAAPAAAPAPALKAKRITPPAPGAGAGAGRLATKFDIMKEEARPPMEKHTIDTGMLRDQGAQATTIESKDFGEIFEYKINRPVSIKRQQSALVPIVNADIEGRKILVYNAAKNKQNPMACVELTNTTGLTLEKGPVTLFFAETLAGEAMFPFLNQGETRIVSYAIEQGVVILFEDRSETHGIHNIRISDGTAYEYYYFDRKREYKINNKTEEKKILILDHPRTSGYALLNEEPHKETSDAWRFELNLASKQGVTFTILERQETFYTFSLWNISPDSLQVKIAKYATENFLSAEIEEQLGNISQMNDDLRALQVQISDLEATLRRIENDQDRLRENLKTLQMSDSELRLRETYITKLSEQEDEYESAQARLKELRVTVSDLNLGIKKLIDELVL